MCIEPNIWPLGTQEVSQAFDAGRSDRRRQLRHFAIRLMQMTCTYMPVKSSRRVRSAPTSMEGRMHGAYLERVMRSTCSVSISVAPSRYFKIAAKASSSNRSRNFVIREAWPA